MTGELRGIEQGLTVTLTRGQVTDVLSRVTGVLGVANLLSAVSADEATQELLLGLMDTEGYSRSTLRALLVLTAFPADGSARELTDVARQLRLSPSTTHRYVATWLATGLLIQEPRSRVYRRALPDLPSIREG